MYRRFRMRPRRRYAHTIHADVRATLVVLFDARVSHIRIVVVVVCVRQLWDHDEDERRQEHHEQFVQGQIRLTRGRLMGLSENFGAK